MRIAASILLVALGMETIAPVRSAAEPIAPGTRIRLSGDWPGGGRWVGSFETRERDSIWIARVTAFPHGAGRSIGRHAPFAEDTRVGVPAADVRSLEVSRGLQLDVAHGARIGVFSGIVLGAVLGAVAWDPSSSRSRRDLAGTGAVLLGGVGLIVGGVAGLATRVERWEALPVSSLAPADSTRSPRSRGQER